MLVLLFSLAGVPPMVGFFAKFYVLLAAVDAGLAWLAVAGVVASVIGAFYYLRIVYYMYFGARRDALDAADAAGAVAAADGRRPRSWCWASSTCSGSRRWRPPAAADRLSADGDAHPPGPRASARHRPGRGRQHQWPRPRGCAPTLDAADLDHGAPPDRGARAARPGLGQPRGQFRGDPGAAPGGHARAGGAAVFMAALALFEALATVTDRP